MKESVLDPVRVLVLINQDVAEVPLVALPHVFEELEQVDGPHEEVIEVHRVRFVHPLFVELEDSGDAALKRGPAAVGRAHQRVDRVDARV